MSFVTTTSCSSVFILIVTYSTRSPSGRVTETRPPRIHPALPQLTCQCVKNGRRPPGTRMRPSRRSFIKKEGSLRSKRNQYIRGISLVDHEGGMSEDCRVSPQQLLRGRRDALRGAVRFSLGTINSRLAVCLKPTARTRKAI